MSYVCCGGQSQRSEASQALESPEDHGWVQTLNSDLFLLVIVPWFLPLGISSNCRLMCANTRISELECVWAPERGRYILVLRLLLVCQWAGAHLSPSCTCLQL